MKRALTALLCLLLMLSVTLTACSTGGNETSVTSGESKADTSSAAESSSADESGEKYIDANGKYILGDMPEYNFTQKTFTVCIHDNIGQTTYYNEEIDPNLYDTTDQYIKDAVSERNNIIEEKYDVKIIAKPVSDVAAEVKLDAEGQTHLYDAAMPFMSEAATMAQEKILFDLTEFDDIIHLDAPWWDHLATETASINNRVYFATGDISIMPKIVSFAITFNKGIMEELHADVDLYQMVKDHTWTYDYMIQLSKEATVESDGVSGMTYADNWGLSSSRSDALCYYLASGESLCTKNSNDVPVISIGNDRSITIATKVLETLQTDDWCFRCEDFTGQVPNIWATSLDVFGEDRCLFRTSAFSAVKKLRNYTNGVEFGLIPLPLMDDTQTDYYTPTNPDYANVVVIPTNVANAEFSAYMLEAMSCYAKNTLTPAYYEIVLKTRDARDAESEEMLDDYIFKNLVYDVGRVYTFGTLKTMLYTLMGQKSTAIASTLDGAKLAIQDAIDKTVALYGGE